MLEGAVLDRPLDRGSAGRSVLVILDVDRPIDLGLVRSALAGPASGNRVRLVLLAPRLGFSTDAALVARARRRLDARCAAVLSALGPHSNRLAEPADLERYARTPLGKPVEQVRRAAQRAIRRHRPDVVILPSHLRAEPGDVTSSIAAGDVSDR